MDKPRDQFVFPSGSPIAILGVPFDNVSTKETIQMIEQMVLSRRPHYLVTANVDFLVQASRDVELRRILFDAHLVLCDGTPLVWASRLLGNPLMERVAGSDLVPLLLGVAAEKGYRPFFLGASPDAIEAAVARAREQHPKLQIADYYSPPYNKLLEMDHDAIRERILKAEPDLLFVGFGCPKQEKWINMHYRSLGVPVSVGVGGTIDFLAGRLKRAPRWMQRSGTEWIFRLAQEPRRLLGRYGQDLWHFSGAIGAQYCRLGRRRGSRRGLARAHNRDEGGLGLGLRSGEENGYGVVVLPPRLDSDEVHHRRAELEASITPAAPCILDAGFLEFIDSTGIGLLIRLQKRARCLGQQLIIARPTENLSRALRLMKLDQFFVTADDLEGAARSLQNRAHPGVHLKSLSSAALPVLAWNGELTAANAQELWIATMDYIAARALVQRTLAIDLSNLRFIDSTGLSIMIRARKYGARQGIAIRFLDPQPNVLNVIRLSRLEDYLLKNDA